MTSNKKDIFFISKIKILDNFGINTLLISYKNFKQFLCARENHKIDKLIFFNAKKSVDDFIDALKININEKYINKIIFDKEYLYFSNCDKLYSNKGDNCFYKSTNILFPCLNSKTRQIIILDNKNIVTNEGEKKISFYINKNLEYEKLFNNINKYGLILGICKLDNNEFCFLSLLDNDGLILSKLNQDFCSQEKELKNIEFNTNTLNNIFFRIAKNSIIIVGSSNFIIFNIKHFEIVTIKETDKIYSALSFTLKNQGIGEEEYLALIIEKEGIFYLQIYKFEESSFRESTKINLNECSLEINSILEKDKNEFEKIENESKSGSRQIFDNFLFDEFSSKIKELRNKKVSFDLNYDIKINNQIVFIVGINSFLLNKRFVILLEINLDVINFN